MSSRSNSAIRYWCSTPRPPRQAGARSSSKIARASISGRSFSAAGRRWRPSPISIEIGDGRQRLPAAEKERPDIDALAIFEDDLAPACRGGLGVEHQYLIAELLRLLIEMEHRENHLTVGDKA